jgi:hypothetical protein
MNKSLFCLLVICLFFVGCRNKKDDAATVEENRAAKQMLQGIWMDEDEQNVVFKAKGDTIFYPDTTSVPVYFQIVRDTLVLHGSSLTKYPILKQTAHLFVFVNTDGEEIHLVKSNDSEDAQLFKGKHSQPLNQNQLIKRDTVIVFNNERYHCYVQVNPTTYKVVKPTYNDDGVEVDNVYYDNIVNLNIYHGAQKLFSGDFHKRQFARKVPADFLSHAVLSDLIFDHVGDKGISYTAILVMPDSQLSFQVELTVSFSGRLTMAVK